MRAPENAVVALQVVRELVMLMCKTACFTLVVHDYVAGLVFVEGESMEPSIANGALCLVDRTAALRRRLTKASASTHGFERGDVVVFRCPADRSGFWIKRIAALAGDEVRFTGRSGLTRLETVRAGAMWVEGDNAPRSRDSRMEGQLPLSLVQGQVIAQLYPPKWIPARPAPSTGPAGHGVGQGQRQQDSRNRGAVPRPSDTTVQTPPRL